MILFSFYQCQNLRHLTCKCPFKSLCELKTEKEYCLLIPGDLTHRFDLFLNFVTHFRIRSS